MTDSFLPLGLLGGLLALGLALAAKARPKPVRIPVRPDAPRR